MKLTAPFVVAMLCGFYSCNDSPENDGPPLMQRAVHYAVVINTDDDTTATVKLPNYTLINDSMHDHRDEAREIISIKRQWPLAMQSLDRSAFESILSRDFTFKGTDTFFNRANYIRNRTTADDWKIVHVDYDNVTLQFSGASAILSYRNHVQNKHVHSGAIETEHMSWVDIFIKEDGNWKIDASHTIDYRLEVHQ